MSISTEIQRLQNAKENIKNAIEETGVSVGNGLLDTYPDKINEIFENGKKSERVAFWESYQEGGTKSAYANAFYRWKDEFYNPLYDIVSNDISNLYSYSTITDTKVNITYTGTEIGAPFYMANRLVKIKNLILINETKFAATTFRNAIALKDIVLSGEGKIATSTTLQYSQYLSKESIKSIINALSSSITAEQTLTLYKNAVVNAFGSDYATPGTEWMELITPKTEVGWKISLI